VSEAIGALASEEPGYRTARARTAALIAAVGIGTFFAYVIATRKVFLFDLGRVAPILTGLIVVNLALGVTAQYWASWRRAILVYQVLQIALFTVTLHRLGGVVLGIFFVTYAFPIILSEMVDLPGSVFTAANVCAASFGAMTWVESRTLAELGIDAPQQIAFVAFAFLVLNFVAIFTDRYGYQLRNLAGYLQRKVAERTAELTAANDELSAKARALEAKQDELRSFVYTVTHDLKGPLSNILLTADLALQREGRALGAECREDLERIARLAGGTEDMIRDLLEMFRITSLPESPTWVELDAIVERALETLAPQITAKHVQVDVGRLPRVWGHPRKLSHAVANLLGNALKYVAADRGRVSVEGALDDGHAVLSVHDNGIGIPAAYHRGIFEVFGRAPAPEQMVDGRSVAGTGVGLAIVKRIVEGHRGTVSVDSEPGVGSRFTVRLPVGREEGA
jgi:signal transduction histidine kinase